MFRACSILQTLRKKISKSTKFKSMRFCRNDLQFIGIEILHLIELERIPNIYIT